jgi:hypothetical protein
MRMREKKDVFCVCTDNGMIKTSFHKITNSTDRVPIPHSIINIIRQYMYVGTE